MEWVRLLWNIKSQNSGNLGNYSNFIYCCDISYIKFPILKTCWKNRYLWSNRWLRRGEGPLVLQKQRQNKHRETGIWVGFWANLCKAWVSRDSCLLQAACQGSHGLSWSQSHWLDICTFLKPWLYPNNFLEHVDFSNEKYWQIYNPVVWRKDVTASKLNFHCLSEDFGK